MHLKLTPRPDGLPLLMTPSLSHFMLSSCFLLGCLQLWRVGEGNECGVSFDLGRYGGGMPVVERVPP